MRKLVIVAGQKGKNYWHDIWHYRELFYILAWRDIIVRYKQTAIGASWAVLRPLLTMLILCVVFGRVAKLPSEGVPYPILVFSALLPWQFFANALSDSTASLVGNANLISKVYFPRIMVPASTMIVSMVDFGISFIILVALCGWYRFIPDARILLLPIFSLLALLAALGPGLLVAALNVEYRDFRYVIPFIVQFGLYISPVGFSSAVIPEQWRLLYSLNPMVGVIDAFRWSICGTASIWVPGLLASIGGTLLFLLIGVLYFRRTENHFADVI